MATELHRIDGALTAAEAALDEIGAAEELAIEAALSGADATELSAMMDGLASRFRTAIFRLALARQERRDHVTLYLSAPELGVPLTRWVRGLVGVLEARRWSVIAHAMAARDQAGAWARSPAWGPPRGLDWLERQLEGEGPRNLMLRVSGPDAALHLALEAGAHRFHKIAKVDPCHLIVRVLALEVEHDDDDWRRISDMATPALAPRGEVGRVYPDEDRVVVDSCTVAVPFASHFSRYPEIGLHVIAHALRADRTVADLYGNELDAVIAAEAAAKEKEAAEAAE
jgi:hypothetical protein